MSPPIRPRAMRLRRLLAGLIALCAAACSVASGAPAPVGGRSTTGSAFVRVDQLGYPSGASKRAYLIAAGSENGAKFSVVSGGTTVLTAPLGRDLGHWSARFPHVYAIDFTGVRSPGSYSISVGGPFPAASPEFQIGDPATLDAGAIANALAFYQAERDGPDFIPSALRTAPGHLNDADAMTYLTPAYDPDSGEFKGNLTALGKQIDAAGGWWDAGDYLKFVETTSYTVDVLLAGVRDFPSRMGPGSASNFSDEALFGVRWLMHMWNDRTRTLYYQVGIGAGNGNTISDHDIWRLPQADDTYGGHSRDARYIRHRPVFRAGPPGSKISPNLAGRLAAAFAECFQVFRSTHPSLANRCLMDAEHVFALADSHPPGDLLTVIPFSFYPETEWRDDMELGATELYVALASDRDRDGLVRTNPNFYLRSAALWANAYIHGPNDATDTLNLYDLSGLAHFELANAIRSDDDPPRLQIGVRGLVADLGKQLDSAVSISRRNPFGFGFPWASWDTTSHGAGLSVMASEYDQLTGTSRYATFGDRWLANILGANAWGLSFIVGDGSSFPHCLQHQVANIVGSLDGSGTVLAGAAVEGPNSQGASGTVDGMKACPADGSNVYKVFNGRGSEFKDNMESYPNTEPAIDLTATSPLAFARLAAGLR
jgi:endoglucanase